MESIVAIGLLGVAFAAYGVSVSYGIATSVDAAASAAIAMMKLKPLDLWCLLPVLVVSFCIFVLPVNPRLKSVISTDTQTLDL